MESAAIPAESSFPGPGGSDARWLPVLVAFVAGMLLQVAVYNDLLPPRLRALVAELRAHLTGWAGWLRETQRDPGASNRGVAVPQPGGGHCGSAPATPQQSEAGSVHISSDSWPADNGAMQKLLEEDIQRTIHSCMSHQGMSRVRLTGWLGRGAFSNVYRAMWGTTETALKICKVEVKERYLRMIRMETAISCSACHPNVVTTYRYSLHRSTKTAPQRSRSKPKVLNDSSLGAKSMDGEELERANEDQEEKTAGRRGLRQVEVIEVRLLQECCNLGPLRTAIKRNKLTKGHDMLTPDPVTEHLPGARDIPTDGHLSQVQTPDDRMSQGSICGVEGMMTVETFHKMLAAARHDEPMPLAEQMGGQETCHSDNNQDMSLVLSIVSDVCEGMVYLHSRGIIHGDLKASNVLLKTSVADGVERVVAKVSDFGTSVMLEEGQTEVTNFFAGTPTHMAPETLEFSVISKASDVYSFGILLYEIASGDKAYPGRSAKEIMREVVEVKLRPRIQVWIYRPLLLLMTNCWQHDPARRPTFAMVQSSLSEIAKELCPTGVLGNLQPNQGRVAPKRSRSLSVMQHQLQVAERSRTSSALDRPRQGPSRSSSATNRLGNPSVPPQVSQLAAPLDEGPAKARPSLAERRKTQVEIARKSFGLDRGPGRASFDHSSATAQRLARAATAAEQASGEQESLPAVKESQSSGKSGATSASAAVSPSSRLRISETGSALVPPSRSQNASYSSSTSSARLRARQGGMRWSQSSSMATSDTGDNGDAPLPVSVVLSLPGEDGRYAADSRRLSAASSSGRGAGGGGQKASRSSELDVMVEVPGSPTHYSGSPLGHKAEDTACSELPAVPGPLAVLEPAITSGGNKMFANFMAAIRKLPHKGASMDVMSRRPKKKTHFLLRRSGSMKRAGSAETASAETELDLGLQLEGLRLHSMSSMRGVPRPTDSSALHDDAKPAPPAVNALSPPMAPAQDHFPCRHDTLAGASTLDRQAPMLRIADVEGKTPRILEECAAEVSEALASVSASRSISLAGSDTMPPHRHTSAPQQHSLRCTSETDHDDGAPRLAAVRSDEVPRDRRRSVSGGRRLQFRSARSIKPIVAMAAREFTHGKNQDYMDSPHPAGPRLSDYQSLTELADDPSYNSVANTLTFAPGSGTNTMEDGEEETDSTLLLELVDIQSAAGAEPGDSDASVPEGSGKKRA